MNGQLFTLLGFYSGSLASAIWAAWTTRSTTSGCLPAPGGEDLPDIKAYAEALVTSPEVLEKLPLVERSTPAC